MNTRAAAYIRRSSVSEDSPGDVSREVQLGAVRALAEANGVDPDSLQVFEDWGKSADETKKEKRTAYVALVQAIEDRKLDSVFVYHIDRIIRSVRDFTDLQRAADGHTAILTPQFPLTGTDPMARAFAQVAAVFAELELNRIKQRNKKALDVRIARGDALGRPTWGMMHVRNGDAQMVEVTDPDKAAAVRAVLDAVKEAGTILGAVKLLNEQGIPAPKGGEWHTSPLTRVVKAHAPDLIEHKRRKGRPAGPALLARLVRCHCGQIMTPNAARKQLYCYRGNKQGVQAHGRAHVRESDLVPWVMNHAAEVRESRDQGDRRARAEQRRGELIEQRERLGYALTDGLLSREQAKERATAIDTELGQVDSDLAAIGDVPDIGIYRIPDIDPATFARMELSEVVVSTLHDHLRSLMRHVQLDKNMRPTAIEWIGG